MLMEIDEKKYGESVARFAADLRRKGYHARFYILNARSQDKIEAGSTIEGCLEAMLPAFDIRGNADGLLLTTYSDSRTQRYRCTFLLDYSGKNGFHVRVMSLYDNGQQLQHTMRHIPVSQIPGAAMIPTYFPKRKPWDDFLLGKGFKPKL